MIVTVVAIAVLGGGLHVPDFTGRAFHLGVESVAKIKIGRGVKISLCIYRKENHDGSGSIYLRIKVNGRVDCKLSGIGFIYCSGNGPPEGIVAAITVTAHASGSDIVAALIVVSGSFCALAGFVFFTGKSSGKQQN